MHGYGYTDTVSKQRVTSLRDPGQRVSGPSPGPCGAAAGRRHGLTCTPRSIHHCLLIVHLYSLAACSGSLASHSFRWQLNLRPVWYRVGVTKSG